MGFSDPQNIISQFSIGEGMKVADFGVGSGFYAIEAGKSVGDSGTVYAIDVQKELLSRVATLAKENKLSNVEMIWGDIEEIGGSTLMDSSVDVVMVTNILFQLEDKEEMIKEMSRILKPNGRALIVDWSDSFSNMGPKQDDIISQSDAKVLFEKEGLVFERDVSAGENHWGFIVKKSNT